MAVTVNQKPTLDKYGNIRVHALEGLDMPVQRRGESGNLLNIAAAALFFYINGVGRWPLAAGIDNTERRVQVTPADLLPLEIDEQTTYALVDETGSVPITLLEGRFKVEGFRVS